MYYRPCNCYCVCYPIYCPLYCNNNIKNTEASYSTKNTISDMRLPNWDSNKIYYGEDQVLYNGKTYEAKWWTKGDTPGITVVNDWNTPWKLTTSSGGGTIPVPSPTPKPTPSTSNVIYPDYTSVDVLKGISIPKKIFAPFVDVTGWPPLKFSDIAKTTSVPYFNLGFIVSQSSTICKPTWGTYYSAEAGPLNDQIKKIRTMGGDVIVSFGGINNVPLQVSAPDYTTLKEQYKRFIKAYGLTRIDFDIEGSWLADSVSLTKNNKALKLLQDELKSENYDLDIWFTLPILPSGLTLDGINCIKSLLNENVILSGINAMTMDYGDSVAPNPNGNMAEYGIQAITSMFNQLKQIYKDKNLTKTDSDIWSMIGTTPMIGMNDVTTEIYNLLDAKETLAFAQKNSIGMISMWSFNRDKGCQGGAVNYVSTSCSSIAQSDYAFSSVFNLYNDLSNFKPNGLIVPVPNPSPTPTPTPSPMGNAWNVDKIYVSGDTVTYNNKTYTAKWWTKGDTPGITVKNAWECMER